MRRFFLLVLVAVLGLLGSAVPSFAGGTYTPPTTITFDTVIAPTVLAVGALTLGGAALVAAFGVGGGFRVAKKSFAWIFGKM